MHIFYFSLTGLALSLLLSIILFKGRYDSALIIQDIVLALLSGLLKFFGLVVFTVFVARENSEQVAMLKIFDIFISILVEYLIFAKIPVLLNFIGSCLIMVAITMIFIRKLFLFGNYTNLTIRFNKLV